MDDKSDIEILEEFIHDNVELERLEEIIGDFNIFTALGIMDVEIRHSNFLSWLLDPTETHGLGDYFLAAFLKKVAIMAPAYGLQSPCIFDIDTWHFEPTKPVEGFLCFAHSLLRKLCYPLLRPGKLKEHP